MVAIAWALGPLPRIARLGLAYGSTLLLPVLNCLIKLPSMRRTAVPGHHWNQKNQKLLNNNNHGCEWCASLPGD